MYLLFGLEPLTFIFFLSFLTYRYVYVGGMHVHMCVQVCVDGVLRLMSGILISLLSSLKRDLSYL